MPGSFHPPRIFLRMGEGEFRTRLESALAGFPLSHDTPPDLAQWPLGCLQLMDLEAALEFVADTRNAAAPLLALSSTLVAHPQPLPAETKASLYQTGFAFIGDADPEYSALKSRLQALVRLRSRLLAEQAVSRRLQSQLDAQQVQVDHQIEFLHMAVHDLRGPLAAMICYAELLMEGVLGNLQSTQLEPIRTIHRNCQFLVDMVNDLLDSARIGMGKLALKLEKTNFTREVENAVQALRSLAETKGIRLRVEAEPIPEMFLDVQKVGRILTNLLGNAIKFTRASGEIVLRVARHNNSLVFSIQDMGPGISVADRKAIFEKFNTGSGSNMPGKGHGLGLAICKSFVELHGGKIFVESTRHKGSVFIVQFPLEKRKGGGAHRPSRKVLLLDLGGDVPGLEGLTATSHPGLRWEVLRPDPAGWSWEKLPGRDFLLVNENGSGGFGPDYFLLQLGEKSGGTPCGVVVSADLPEPEKELRRHLGLWIFEKPCTPQEISDKLQGIVGVDRRQRSR